MAEFLQDIGPQFPGKVWTQAHLQDARKAEPWHYTLPKGLLSSIIGRGSGSDSMQREDARAR